MIAKEQIKILVNKYQTTELNIRREYLQHLFLSYFYRQREAEKICFKGGTALRIVYASPRFSQDLDFSSTIKSAKNIEKTLLQTLHEIEREGINVGLAEAKPTSGGYLGIISFKLYGEEILLQLHISFRQGKAKSGLVTIASDFIPAYTVVGMLSDELVGEKIQALFQRQKPRDYYDLYFILRASLLPIKQKSILSKALLLLKKSDINFGQELKQLLPKSHWLVIRDFKVTLEREIRRNI